MNKYIITLSGALTFIFLLFFLAYCCLSLDDNQNLEAYLTYSVISVLLSTCLLVFAWWKTDVALAQSRMNYLLKIDERWSSREIIEAREVIHELYLNAKLSKPDISNDQEAIKKRVAHSILEMSKDKKKIKDFLRLLNFLDFLETIGYMHQRNSITDDEVNELLGNSLVYFFEIYIEYILYRRRTKDLNFYTKFERLYQSIRANPNSLYTPSR